MSAPKRAQEDPVKRSDEETQDEIEQIMSEIEQLQKEIGQTEAGPMPTPAARKAERPKPTLVKNDGPEIESGFTETDPLEEFRAGAGSSEGGMEDTIGEMKVEDTSSGNGAFDSEFEGGDMHEAMKETQEAIARASREVEEAFEESDEENSMRDHDDAGNGNDSALNMTLKGNMTLRLQYEVDGQTVTIGFADQCLHVKLADGTEFKVPMRRPAPVRRSA
jgi:hypothetical protein